MPYVFSCPSCFALYMLSCLTCLVPYMSRALLRALVTRVPCSHMLWSQRASYLTCPRAWRILVPHVLRALRDVVPHMSYVILCLACFVTCVFSCCLCLVSLMLFCSSSLICFRCFKPNILISISYLVAYVSCSFCAFGAWAIRVFYSLG